MISRLGKCIALIMLMGCQGNFIPEAKQGVLDLRKWDSSTHPVVVLRGEWEYYDQEVLEPGTIKSEKSFYEWPLLWTNNQGYASYRLLIQLPSDFDQDRISFEKPFQSTAARYFVNGKKIFESGTFSTEKNTSIPSRQRDEVEVAIEGEELELIVHLSNFHHARGGTWYSIKMGSYSSLSESRQKRIIADAVIIFMALGIGVFYLSRCLVGVNLIDLSLGLSGICLALRYSVINERIFEIFFTMPFSIGLRLEYLSLYVLYEIYVLFSAVYFRKITGKYLIPIYGLLSLLLNATLLLPTLVFSNLLILAHIFALVGTIHMMTLAIKGWQQSVPGSAYIFGGFIVLLLFTVVDTLLINIMRHYEFFFASWGNLSFLLAQSLAAGSREKVFLRHLKEERSGRTHS